MTFQEIKEKLKHKTVGIAGAGGLGSNCAVALARVGVGKLIITDFDTIDESNLNRQYYFFDQIGKKKVVALYENILRVNPQTKVIAIDKKLKSSDIPKLFEKCDVIVEAFDLPEMKKMLIETSIEELPETPLVCGLGMSGFGMNEIIHCRKVDNLYICGDEVTEAGDKNPPLAPRVGIVANMQANTILDILLNN